MRGWMWLDYLAQNQLAVMDQVPSLEVIMVI